MNFRFGYCSAAVVALAAVCGPAWADLKGQDVWSDWVSYMEANGYEVTGTQSQSGNTLTVSDVTMAMAAAEGAGADMVATMRADKMEFMENGDGSVSIMLPAVMPMEFSGTDMETEKPFALTVNIEQSGMSMTAAGTPTDLTYTYTAPSMSMQLASLMVDGEDMSSNVSVLVKMTNAGGNTKMAIGDMRVATQAMNVDSLSYDIAFDVPESDDSEAATGTVVGSVVGLAFEASSTTPLEKMPYDLQAMLKAGFEGSGTGSYDSGKLDVNGTGDGASFQYSSASQGGDLEFAMSAAQLIYGLSQKQTAINVSGSQIPFPVSLEMAKYGMRLMMPLSQSDEAQDFELGVTLGDFTMSDMLWNIFDAGAVLPRDPATILVDLAGKAKILVDFLDPAVTADLENSETAPAEFDSLAIRNLLISAVGAELTGTGDVTFDNSKMMPGVGIPQPAGEVNLKLVGANGLIDKLITMGLLSDQDAMGARMMMGMLAVPGEGDDTLTSKIEMNAEGHIMANGQRIQ